MDQDTKNQLERHDSLRAYFVETKLRWEGVPVLKKRVDVYFTCQGALPTPPPDADAGNTVTTGARAGATQDKGTARQQLALQLPAIAASLHLWLLDADHLPADETAAAKQRELAARLDIRRPSALTNMAAGALIGLAQAALAALAALVLVPEADLAEYDLTTGDTKAFEDAAKLFGVRRTQPTTVGNAASTAAETLEETLDDLDSYVRGELRKAVDTRRFKDAEFVRGFKRAYRLNDRRGARKGKSSDGSAPANG